MTRSTVVLLSLALYRLSPAADPLPTRLEKAEVTHFAKIESYSEGPTWRNGEVVFCGGVMWRADGKTVEKKWPTLNPAGTALLADGRLLVCDNKHKALLVIAANGTGGTGGTAGTAGVLAEAFDGKPLNSLNDVTVDARGNVYWTDPSGSTLEKRTGNVFRLTPAGKVDRIATGLAFPNGLDVDPTGKFLFVMESQTKKVLRYAVPADDQPLGKAEDFYELGGSGPDGCAFDADGNLWVADFHRPDTKTGRLTVIDPAGKLIGHFAIPAEYVTNLTFGGPQRDEIYSTAGNPGGVFRVRAGVKGFAGHPGAELKTVRKLDLTEPK
jgi:gluconolactonase